MFLSQILYNKWSTMGSEENEYSESEDRRPKTPENENEDPQRPQA